MMPAVELLVGALLCSGVGCADPTEVSVPPPNITVTSSGECVRVTFEITSSTTVTGTYPGASCPTVGLIVAKPANMTWVGGTRTLTIPMMVRNTTALPIQLPLRLELPVDGKVVMLPTGTSNSKLVPLNMDSTLAADRKVWLIGVGTLAPGDSTAPRDLTFRIDAPVTKGRFWFVGQGEEIVNQWPVLTGLPALDVSKTVIPPGDTAKYFRTNVWLFFKPGTTDSAKAALFGQFGMTVIGYYPGGGRFYVTIPDPGPTFNDLGQAVQNIRSHPSISAVGMARLSPDVPQINARYPSDGPGMARSDYFNNSATTWAARAVRLPLAWGCEQGGYGGTSPHVANLEWRHEPGHPEYAPIISHQSPPDNLLAGQPGMLQANAQTLADWRAHAAGTTGALTARADNGSGVAGAMWKSNLHLLSMTTPAGWVFPVRSTVIPLLSSWSQALASARVITIQADVFIDSTGQLSAQDRRDLVRGIALHEFGDELFAKYPQILAVASLGNAKIRGPYSSYVLDPQAQVLTAALLWLRDSSAYADRIVVVAGTGPSNVFWAQSTAKPTQGSNFVTGLTDIAAPAGGVYGLGLWAGQTGATIPTQNWHGTSIAAPMVAGVAAQLLTMDPSLTPAQVKDYIIRGTQVSKPDTAGNLVPAAPVSGAPATIYQLDAYGSLRLLASERSGVPICGNEVGHDISGALKIVRRPGVLETIAGSGTSGSYRASVAQGGRLVAAIGFNTTDPVGRYFELQNGSWQQRATTSSPGVVSVQFLEKDTAIVKLKTLGTHVAGGPLLLSVSGNPSVQNLDLGGAAGHPNSVFGNSVTGIEVSSDGQWAFFVARYPNASQVLNHTLYVDSLGPSAPVALQAWVGVNCPTQTVGSCPNNYNGSVAVWRHDSRWITTVTGVFENYCDIVNFSGCGQNHEARFHRFTPSTGTSSHVLTTADGGSAHILSGDDATWRECGQAASGGLITRIRQPTTLAVVSTQSGCILQVGYSTIGNTPSFSVAARP